MVSQIEENLVFEIRESQFVILIFIEAHFHFAGDAARQHDIQFMNVDDNNGLLKELQNIVKNDSKDILNMKVMMTIVDGQIVFKGNELLSVMFRLPEKQKKLFSDFF